MATDAIHNRIRELRFKHAEMTQQDLADQVGITRQTVIALEKEKFYPSLELAFRISRLFGLPLEEVFQFAPKTVKKPLKKPRKPKKSG